MDRLNRVVFTTNLFMEICNSIPVMFVVCVHGTSSNVVDLYTLVVFEIGEYYPSSVE